MRSFFLIVALLFLTQGLGAQEGEDIDWDSLFETDEPTIVDVPDPEVIVHEMKRIIKPGGTVIAAVPFMQPFTGCSVIFRQPSQQRFPGLWQASVSLSLSADCPYRRGSALLIWDEGPRAL